MYKFSKYYYVQQIIKIDNILGLCKHNKRSRTNNKKPKVDEYPSRRR